MKKLFVLFVVVFSVNNALASTIDTFGTGDNQFTVEFVDIFGNATTIPIVNSSFEDISGMTDSGYFADGVPTGWSFTGTKVQALQSPPYSPSGIDGSYYIEILKSPDFGTLSQSVPGLVIEQQYELSFLWGNRMSGYDFTVEMGGSSFGASGYGLVNMIAESFTFTATATVENLNIIWHDSGEDSVCGGAIDAFVLEAIPEPTTLLLLGMGGLLIRKRR